MEGYIKSLMIKSPGKMISYADYISAALYHPLQGYYMKSGEKIGRDGDFFTTSNVSAIYGQVAAKWYQSKYELLHLPAAVCELGGGNGRFARAFLEGWYSCTSIPLSYCMVETSPYHHKLQEEALKEYDGISFYHDIGELEDFAGLVFSNELFDALPVHVIRKKQGKLQEVMVTFTDKGFAEGYIPLQNDEIISFIGKYGIELDEGQRMEIPLEMENVVRKIADSVSKGLVVTVDYGYTTEEWQHPSRRDGSLRGYYRHEMKSNILENPGRMDITSHVHFDILAQQGEEYGMKLISKTRQDEFLISIGILDELAENADPNPFSANGRRNRAIKSLIMPGGISNSFQVLVQGKGTDLDGWKKATE